MATIKPKDLNRYLKNKVETIDKRTSRKWQRLAKPLIKEEIFTYIGKGLSPVQGKPRYQQYSSGYKKQIQSGYKKPKTSIKPVNLKVTGKMLESIKIRLLGDGASLAIWFSSKIAKYHNGQGRVERKMLPTENGEHFRRDIKRKLSKLYQRLFSRR